MEETGSRLPLTDEDRQILLIIRELRRQLNLNEWDYSANTVSWTDRFFLRRAPPEYVRLWLGDVGLPLVLKGRLSPEEWRPLLASNLVYFGLVNKKTLRLLGEFVLLPSIVPAIVFELIVQKFWVGLDPSQLLGWSLGIMFGLAFIGINLMGRQLAWMRLKADREAARLVGKDQLRKSLERVDEIVGRAVSFQATLRMKPSLADRIRNLEGI